MDATSRWRGSGIAGREVVRIQQRHVTHLQPFEREVYCDTWIDSVLLPGRCSFLLPSQGVR